MAVVQSTMAVVHEEENTAITVAVDWLQLAEHVTSFIFSKLSSIFDYARFGHVCLQWRSIFREQYYCAKSFLPPQPPLLVIPTPPEMMTKKKKKNDTSTISCSFYRVADGKIFNRLKLKVPHHRQFRGCGFGWLITVDEELCNSVQLANPFFYPNTATKEIKLPPLTTHPTEISGISHPDYIRTLCPSQEPVLSADPASNPKDCVLKITKPSHLHMWNPHQQRLGFVIFNIVWSWRSLADSRGCHSASPGIKLGLP